MLKIVMMLAALLAATQANAERMLLERAPEYEYFERFVRGVAIHADGTRQPLMQYARRVRGKTLVTLEFLDKRGDVEFWFTKDADTHAQWGKGPDGEDFETVSTTCSNKELYPIVMRKSYECHIELSKGGEVLWARKRLEFTEARFEPVTHRLLGFCARFEDRYLKHRESGKICSTPDGKWITSIHFDQ